MRRQFACALLWAMALSSQGVAATDHWVKVSSAHFTVVSDASERDARRIVDQFERMRWVFQALFPKADVDPAEPIVVVGAKNGKVFASMEPADYLGRGKLSLGGYFLHTSDKNYILLRLDAEFQHPYATVYHEYTHLQFEPDAEWMPLWLNEGLAEFMQNTEIRNKDVLLGEPSVEDILYLREHQMIPLSVLFKVDVNSPYYHEEQKGSVFYAESWALTHYFMVNDREKHLHRLSDYMAAARKGTDPLTAAEEAFGDLKKLERTLDLYIQASMYKQFVLSSAAAPIDESAYKVSTLTPVEADAVRANVLACVGRTADAKALLETVLKGDANNVQALETMGFLAIRSKDMEEARKWYGEAVKADSQDYLAHYYYASLSMGVAGGGEDEEIESSLRTAIRLNPRFAPSYDRLAAFYGMRHEHLDEAHMLSLHAVELDPANVVYRINAADVLMSMGQDANALTVLKAAEKVAKNPAEEAMVQNQMEQVQRFEAARAQAETASRPAPKVVVAGTEIKHPTEAATGPKLVVAGVIRHISCYYPTGFEFEVETKAGKDVKLYNNDFVKIDLTAFGFIPKESMNPCKDFEGMKVRAKFVATPDKTVDGQVVAMELRK